MGRPNLPLPKVLLNVTVQRSLGPVQILLAPDCSVADLIKAAVEAYAREGRRPLLPGTDPSGYELHYSQFSLECLNPEEKLMDLGSRNFFLCTKQTASASAAAADCRRDEEKKLLRSLHPPTIINSLPK